MTGSPTVVAACVVGGGGELVELGTGGAKQPDPIVVAEVERGGCRPLGRRFTPGSTALAPGVTTEAGAAAGFTSAASPVASANARTGAVQSGVDPALGVAHVLGVRGQALAEDVSLRRGLGGEVVDLRPRTLGVDVVGCQGRDAAPVVDTRFDEQPQFAWVGEVRRHLDAHVGAEHESRDGDRGEVVVHVGIRSALHRRAGLRAEVLHDDLLHVAVAIVDLAQGHQ